MEKYTTKQLQDSAIELRKRTDSDAFAAYQMVFDELNARMGDEAFDAWCEAQGW